LASLSRLVFAFGALTTACAPANAPPPPTELLVHPVFAGIPWAIKSDSVRVLLVANGFRLTSARSPNAMRWR